MTKTRKPRKRTPELEQAILDGLVDGKSLNETCRANNIDSAAVRLWVVTDDSFAARFRIARMAQAHQLVDKLAEELDRPAELDENGRVDNGAVQLRRLRVDTYKWILAKVLPKVYGDKLTLGGDPDAPIKVMTDDEVMRDVLALLAMAQTRQLQDPSTIRVDHHGSSPDRCAEHTPAEGQQEQEQQ